MIEIRDLQVSYNSQPVLQNINMTIPTGHTCAIIGPSGCGKSTLLRALAGIITDYSGSIAINSQKVDPKTHNIGFIPQNYGLLPWQTVRSNVELGLKIKQRNSPAIETKIQFLLDKLGIGDFGDRYPGELSGGQQQRVSLARAFLLLPDVLLMDEPFSALDALTREDIQDVFMSIWQQHHVTTVLVTHYVEEAVYLGQQIVIMSPNYGEISHVIDNPLVGCPNARFSEDYFDLCLRLKQLVKGEQNHGG